MYDAELIVKSENDLSPAALYSAVTGEKLADVEYRNLSNITKGYVSFYDGDARLYGILDAAPYGFASYDPDDMNLRYAATLQDGTDVELLLRYEDSYLTEILIQSI